VVLVDTDDTQALFERQLALEAHTVARNDLKNGNGEVSGDEDAAAAGRCLTNRTRTIRRSDCNINLRDTQRKETSRLPKMGLPAPCRGSRGVSNSWRPLSFRP
jgi:hypothetical protein